MTTHVFRSKIHEALHSIFAFTIRMWKHWTYLAFLFQVEIRPDGSFHKWIFRCENWLNIIRWKINLDICIFHANRITYRYRWKWSMRFPNLLRLFSQTAVTKGCSDKPTKGRARGGFLGKAQERHTSRAGLRIRGYGITILIMEWRSMGR